LGIEAKETAQIPIQRDIRRRKVWFDPENRPAPPKVAIATLFWPVFFSTYGDVARWFALMGLAADQYAIVYNQPGGTP
jgi:hypothetical protein